MNDCLGTGVKVIRADKSCQLWPLEICCTVGEEDGGQTQCVHHGEEVTPLKLPVLLGATQTGGIVEHSIGEGLSLSPYHVPQLIQGELCIPWVLPDVDSASLKSTMSHLSIESKETPLASTLSQARRSLSCCLLLLSPLSLVFEGSVDDKLCLQVSFARGKLTNVSRSTFALMT